MLAVSGCSRQQSDWEKTRAANTTDAYELFLKKYPSGEFTAQAQARVKELYEERDWQKARDTDTLEAYQAFLKQYPEGKWTEEARIRVENFTLAQAPSNRTAPPPQPAGRHPRKSASGAACDSRCAQNRAVPPAAKSPPAAAKPQPRGAVPTACSSAHSSPVPMRPTSAGRKLQKEYPKTAGGAVAQGLAA